MLTASQLTWALSGITEGGGKSVFTGRSEKLARDADEQLLKWQVSEALYKLLYEDYSQDNSKLGGSHFNKLHRYIIKILLKNIALMYIHEDILLYICIRREIVLPPHRNYASCYTHV